MLFPFVSSPPGTASSGGGLASVNSQTGPAITLGSTSGTITYNLTSPNNISLDVAGLVTSVNGAAGAVVFQNTSGFSFAGSGTNVTMTPGNITPLSVIATNGVSGASAAFASLVAGGIVKANVTTGALAIATPGTDYMVGSNNLSDLVNDTTALSNLGSGLNGQSYQASISGANDALWIYSASANASKKIAIQDVFKTIDGLTSKGAPVAADEIVLNDSAASFAPKKTTVGALPVAASQLTTNTKSKSPGMTFTNGGAAIAAGAIGYLFLDYACTINSVVLGGNVAGSAVVDIWALQSTSAMPTVANTITASDLPTLSSAQNYFDNTLTGWTTAIAANTWLAFKLNSAATLTSLVCQLNVTTT